MSDEENQSLADGLITPEVLANWKFGSESLQKLRWGEWMTAQNTNAKTLSSLHIGEPPQSPDSSTAATLSKFPPPASIDPSKQ